MVLTRASSLVALHQTALVSCPSMSNQGLTKICLYYYRTCSRGSFSSYEHLGTLKCRTFSLRETAGTSWHARSDMACHVRKQ